MEKNNEKIKIVLIDSGVCTVHPALKDIKSHGIYIKRGQKERSLEISKDISDSIGHGTAIYYILQKMQPKADIFIVKLFEEQLDVDTELLVDALNYIHEHIKPDIVHLSIGVLACNNREELETACNRMVEEGTIIVSAFANEGCISYPAAFDNVIGVDMCLSCKRISEYEYVHSSVINIRGVGITQTLPWKDSSYKLVAGSSFAAPYITARIVALMSRGIRNLKDILSELESEAKFVHRSKPFIKNKEVFHIDRAIVFPFNKEVHSIVKFSHLLTFNLIDVFDIKHLGNVNKKVSELFNVELEKDYMIKNIESINWDDDFDTVIIGHTREIDKITGKDYKEYIISKCLKYKKNLYTFDSLEKYGHLVSIMSKMGIYVYTPEVTENNVPTNRFGKLYKISTPVLGIFGTSSKQGKFSLQLTLRNLFQKNGYKIGQLGTEPSAPLFGFDEVYPMGYDATVKVDGFNAISVVNNMMHNIEKKNPDLIIVGSQSQTVAYSMSNLKYIPVSQYNFLHGCDPDGYILSVNFFDDIDYIKRTINYLESVGNGQVIALVLFPLDNDLQWAVLGNTAHKVRMDDLEEKKKYIEDNTDKKVFILGVEEEMKGLYEACLNYYSA
jgi:uncharacterized NAD-dependent epimerase/dehydratase family protein